MASPKSERWAQPSGHHSPAGGGGDSPCPPGLPSVHHSQKVLMTVFLCHSPPVWYWLILEAFQLGWLTALGAH